MTHVLIGYSWGTVNIGSIAIAPGLAHLFASRRPDVRVTVLTSQEESEPEYDWVKRYFARRFPQYEALPMVFAAFLGHESKTDAWRQMEARFGDDLAKLCQEESALSQERGRAIMEYVLTEFADAVIAELDAAGSPVTDAFRDADLFCATSGTMLNFGRAGKRQFWDAALRWAMPLVIARRLGKPYGVYANSFEMLAPPSDWFYQQLFGDAKFLTFRDGESMKYIQSLGIHVPGMAYRPDSAFFFPTEDEAYADEFLRRHNLEAEGFITVIIRTGIQHGPLSNVIQKEREERHMALLREFIEKWTAKTGIPVLLCPEVEWEIEPMRSLVYDRLSPEAKAKSVWMDTFWMPEEAKAVYRKARIVTSMEVHSIVHAIAAQTPVLHPQFWESGRKAWMLRDLGLEDWLLDIDAITADDFVASALEIDRDYARAKERVKAAQLLTEKLGTEAVEQMLS